MHPSSHPSSPTNTEPNERGRTGRRAGLRARSAAFSALLLAAALAVAQDDGDGLDYPSLLRLADAAPSVTLAERDVERAEREARAIGVPIDLTLSGGYDRRFGTLEPGDALEAEDLGEGDVAPIALMARIDPALIGPGADEAARAAGAIDAARDDLDAARRAARINALEAFQDALRAETAEALAHEDAELARRQTAAARERRDAGAASDLTVAEADLAVAEADQAAAAAGRERALSLRALRSVLGRDVPPPVGPLPSPPPVPPMHATASDARPDVRSAERSVADADRSAAAQVRDVLPVVTLDAGFQAGDDARSARFGASIDSARLAPTLNASFDPDDGLTGLSDGASSRAFEIGVSAEIPLSPAVPDALAAVRIGQEQARARRDAARDRADVAMDRAFAAAHDAAERADLAQRAAVLAEETLAVVRLRAQAGSASDADVRRAELDRRRADLDADRADDGHRLALFRLFDALALAPETLE